VIDRFAEGITIELPRRVSMEPLQPAIEARVLDLLRGGRARPRAATKAAAA
jgi:hypothetical protein